MVHIRCDCPSDAAFKVVAASATIGNLLAAAGLSFLLRRIRAWDGRVVFFVWLLFTYNLLIGAGYCFASGIGNAGDWIVVIRGWEPRWMYQIGLIIVGVVMLMLGVAWSLIELGRIITPDGGKPIARVQMMALVAYFTPFITMLIVGSTQPGGPFAFPGYVGLVAVLGGLSPLLWMMQWFRADMFKLRGVKELNIEGSKVAVVLAVAAIAIGCFANLAGLH